MERVRWYREKAAVDRLREELEILEEEFRRTYKSFTRMNEVWQELAILQENRRGYPAYAWRQADIYSKFANECLFYWKEYVIPYSVNYISFNSIYIQVILV